MLFTRFFFWYLAVNALCLYLEHYPDLVVYVTFATKNWKCFIGSVMFEAGLDGGVGNSVNFGPFRSQPSFWIA